FMSPYSSAGRGVVRLIRRLARSSDYGMWGDWFSWMALSELLTIRTYLRWWPQHSFAPTHVFPSNREFLAIAFRRSQSGRYWLPPTISFHRCRDAARGGGRGIEAQ